MKDERGAGIVAKDDEENHKDAGYNPFDQILAGSEQPLLKYVRWILQYR